MKRSEMIRRLQKRYYFGESEAIADLADEIIDFLVSQGMQPPAYGVQEKNGSYVIQEYTVYNKWEDEE